MSIAGLTSLSGYGTAFPALPAILTGGTAVGQVVGLKQPATATRQTATTGAQTTTVNTTGTNTNATGQPIQTLAAAAGTGTTGTVLSAQQKAQIAEFTLLDQTARADVQAQQRAAGGYAGTTTYQYERGADGTLYAVAGDVTFNVQPVPNNPAATIAAMQTITNAAMSVTPPTAQDLAAVREAAQYTSEAEAALKAAQTGTGTGTGNITTTNTTTKTVAQTAQAKAAQTRAVTAATATLLAAQQQAVGALYGLAGGGFATNTTTGLFGVLGTSANQTGNQFALAA